jgi:AcrR family transcriptional regulator
MVVVVQPPARRAQQRGVDTRRHILDAALREFAAVGFDAASTRAIAARAGVRQGQLTYHFETKDTLWRATIDLLFERFDAEFATASERQSTNADDKAVDVLETGIRALVHAVSTLPELNRIMVHEATVDSDRLAWLVDRHVRARFEQLGALWRQVQDDGDTHLDTDPVVLYYCLLGAASLLYVNAPEARRLAADPDPTGVTLDVDRHADTLVAMLLGPRPKHSSPASAVTLSDESTARPTDH